MSVVKKLIIFFSRERLNQVIILFLGAIIMALIEVVGVASIIPFISAVTNPEIIQENKYLQSAYVFFEFNDSNQFIIGMGGLVLILLIIGNTFSAIMNWRIARFSQMQIHYISTKLLTQYLNQPYIFFLNHNSSDLSKNIHFEVQRCVGGIILPLMQALSRAVVTLLLIALLIIVDPIIAITVIFLLGSSYWIIYTFARKKLNSIGESSTKTVQRRFKIASEAMAGIKDIKLRNIEPDFISRFSYASKKNAEYATLSNVISATPRYALELIAFGGIISIMIFLVGSGQQGSEIIPRISLYALAGYRLMPALQQIYAALANIKFHLPLLNILVDELQETSLAGIVKNDLSSVNFHTKIQLKSISFQYANTNLPTIDKLNMEIIQNTTVGIVGVTGSGKTTLVDIILGLLPIESGEILADEVLINSSNVHNWQKNFGYVPQNIYLTDNTIAQNIAFSASEEMVDLDKVIEASKLARLDEFVQTLPEKYNTLVGERGVRLSGGQIQRIGIARSLYNNPKILVLDEASSSLDGITENVVMDAIHNLAHKKTIIIIAHRMASIKECDVIYMIDSGKITASGSYEELIENNKQFRKMANV